MAINGDVIAYVDGAKTEAVKVTVDGNLVTAEVIDFAALAGKGEIQVYIPAYIKPEADLTAYVAESGLPVIPNTATLNFKDSSGKDGNKPTPPVTVTPPTPVEPPKPEEPKPGEPVKTVSRVEGLEQASELRLKKAAEAFRFDIKTLVPTDEAEDKRINLTALTVTDTLDSLFTVTKEGIAVKVTGTPEAGANYVDEDVVKAQALLDEEKAKLATLQGTTDSTTVPAVADLEAQLIAAKEALQALTASTTTTADGVDAVDNSAAIAAQEQVIAELEAALEAAKTATPQNPSEVALAISNQEKAVAKAEKALEEATAKQAKVAEKLALLTQVNEKGELTPEAIAALGGTIKVEGQDVTVDFANEDTMEALKGYTVHVIIYSVIKDVKALTDDHYRNGIDNTATVQYNHNPDSKFTKKTNTVKVIPPRKTTPPTPEEPTPPITTEVPPTTTEIPPTTGTKVPPVGPSTSSKTVKSSLPKTGEAKSVLGILGVAIGLGALGFYALSKKKRKP